MQLWQRLLLSILVVGMAVLAIATWGSIGSAVVIFALIELGAALLYQRFLTNRKDEFQSE